MAYLKQSTWLEYGPPAVIAPRPVTSRPRVRMAVHPQWRRRGVGDDGSSVGSAIGAAINSGVVAPCGTNPCSVWDLSGGIALPFFMSANCQAYLACQATGAAVTPDPTDYWSLNGGQGTANPGGGGVQSAQAQCVAGGGTWNPLTSTCTSPLMSYVPWLVAGGVALFVLVKAGGRR